MNYKFPVDIINIGIRFDGVLFLQILKSSNNRKPAQWKTKEIKYKKMTIAGFIFYGCLVLNPIANNHSAVDSSYEQISVVSVFPYYNITSSPTKHRSHTYTNKYMNRLRA